jgi:hypothetical protein
MGDAARVLTVDKKIRGKIFNLKLSPTLAAEIDRPLTKLNFIP